MSDPTPVQLAATITISGSASPYTVDVPNVENKRAVEGQVQPAQITYTLAASSVSAGFTLGSVNIKTPSTDIALVSQTNTQFVFSDADTEAVETFQFGFHYLKDGSSYYVDPTILNEDPE